MIMRKRLLTGIMKPEVLSIAAHISKEIAVGIHREYDATGSIINSKIYSDDGMIVSEGIVNEAGNRSGRWKDFYPDGSVQAEGQYQITFRTGAGSFTTGKVRLTEQTGSFNSGRADGVMALVLS
jgi:hypothetical protein